MNAEFEKTIPSLARPTTKQIPLTLSAVVAVCLIFGLLAAVYYQAWATVAILFVGVAALVALLVLQFGELYRFATGKRTNFAWKAVSPEIQRQTLAAEVEQIARHLQIGPDGSGELLSTYIVAHDLALRQVQQEYKAAMVRHAEVGRVSFDALIPEANRLTCVDVSFLIVPELRQEKIDAMLKKITCIGKIFDAEKIGLELRLVIALVTQLDSDDESKLRASLKQKRFASATDGVDIRFFDFEELQRTFLSD